MEMVPRLLLPLPRGRCHGFGPRAEPAQIGLVGRPHHPRALPEDGQGGAPGKGHAVVEGASRRQPDRAALFVRQGPQRAAPRSRQTAPGYRVAMRGWRLGAALACLFSVAARADLLFVADERGDDVRVISTADNAEVAAIAVGKRPRGMCASADRKTVYVALGDEDAVALVDVASRKVTGKLPVGRDPEQVVLSPDGKVLYVSNEAASTATAVELSSRRILFTAPVGTEPEGIAVSPSGAKLYVTGESTDDVTVVDARAGKVLGKFAVGARPRWVLFSADGKQAFVSAEVGGRFPFGVEADATQASGSAEVRGPFHFVAARADKPGKSGPIGDGQTKPDRLALSSDGK